jgi:putative phosphoesterase
MAATLHRSHELAVSDRGLRLVVVSDTHSHPHRATAELIGQLSPDAILHAGDIGSLDVLDALGELAPTIAVRGNIDGRAQLPDSLDISLRQGERVLLRILLTHIALRGPKLRADVVRQAEAYDAHMVVCGHSHVPFIGRDRGLHVFNPGSIGPRRFALPIVFGVMDVSAESLDMRHISCETHEVWLP